MQCIAQLPVSTGKVIVYGFYMVCIWFLYGFNMVSICFVYAANIVTLHQPYTNPTQPIPPPDKDGH